MNTYLDCFDYIRSVSGLEYQSLLGNSARFLAPQTAGSSTLAGLPSTGANSVTVVLAQFDRITIFDGSSSEVVLVGSAGAGIGATSIPLTAPLQYPHSAGVAWCSDGFAGSLADQIVASSSWIEQQVYQPLLSTAWTNELLPMPSIRASFANTGELTFRPRHYPVTSISALSIAVTPTITTSYDTSGIFIDGNQRVCSVPSLIQFPASQSSNAIPPPPARSQPAKLMVSYQAGYQYQNLPGDLREAAFLVTSDIIAKRHNPIGAPDLADGSTRVSMIIRGEKTGESLLIARARMILSRYSEQLY